MKEITLFFKITYFCNNACPFCLVYTQRKKAIPDLTLNDIRKNLEYFSKKFRLHKIVITGGEPTIHPEFFKILKYLKSRRLPINLLTNAINFSQGKFLLRTKDLIFFDNQQENIISFSLNEPPDLNESNIFKKRIKGIVNLAKIGKPTVGVITISRNNAKSLDKIVKFIVSLKEDYSFNLKSIELRMLFLGKGYMPEELEKHVLPPSFNEIKPSLERALAYLNENKIKYNLRNLPLCYLRNPKAHENPGIKERMQIDVYIIDKEKQFNKASIHNGEKYFMSYPSCKNCLLRHRCGGIASRYINIHRYPRLKPIQ